MKSKKIYIVLILILFIFFLIMFCLFGIDNIKKSNIRTTIVVGDDTIWNLQKNKWTSSSRKDLLNWKKFTVFTNNNKLGDYYLWFDDKWYLFDEKKNPVNLDGSLLAYRSNVDLNVLDFSLEEIEDFDYVYKVLEDVGLDLTNDFTVSRHISIDFDNDSILEDFYVISNVFAKDFDPSILFSIVFMVKDNEIYYIYKDISTNHGFNGCKPFFTSFLDTDLDGTSEFMLSCARYSVQGQINMLYKYENNKFKIKISNQ